MRLDRILANSGGGTRSQIKKLIRSGAVSVGDAIIFDPAADIIENDLSKVAIRGLPVVYSKYLYLCLNKPDNCLTALEDPRLATIQQFIPSELRGKGLSPVGRLDYHTTGVLLLMNDGELNHRLTSPKYHLPKTYCITYKGLPVGVTEAEHFAAGFVLTDRPGKKTTLSPSTLVPIDESHCTLTIFEGRTHQVRRMMAAIDREVIALRRDEFVGIRLFPNQAPGNLRELTCEETESLKRACLITKEEHP